MSKQPFLSLPSAVAFAFFSPTAASLAQVPANDDFANRSALTGMRPIMTTGSNVGATGEIDEPLPIDEAEATVWWSWQAPSSGCFEVNTFGAWLAMHPEIPASQRGFLDDPEFDTFPNGVEFLLGLLPMADSRSFATDPNAGRAPLLVRGGNSVRLTVLPWPPNLALGSGSTAGGFFERSTDGKTWSHIPLGAHDGSPQHIEEIFTPGGNVLLRFGGDPGLAP